MADFASIIGQDQATALLQRSLDSGVISHAYLFMGPPGVGKQTTARIFAHLLLQQEDPAAEIYLREGIHPDLMEISLPENRTRISKEQISQDMIPWLAIKPYRARHRIVLIHDSHLMSLEAANALLKTLEEPPEYALIILLSDTAEILETIVSRCQLVNFNTLGAGEIESVLLSRGVEPQLASRVARISQGSLGEALQFCEEKDWSSCWQKALNLIQGLSSGEPVKVLEAASMMEEDLELNVRLVETIIRDRLILQYSDQDNVLVFPESKNIYRQLPRLNPQQVLRGWERINRIKRYSRYHVNRSLIAINIAYEWLHLLQPQVSSSQGARSERR